MISNVGTIENMLKQIVGEKQILPKYVVIQEVDKTYNDCTVGLYEDETVKYFNVKFTPDDKATFIQYPKVGSTATMILLDESTGYITNVSEIEGYYIGNENNSFLELMNDLFTAISNIQLQTNYGPTLPQSLTNIAEFNAVQNKFKNLFLK